MLVINLFIHYVEAAYKTYKLHKKSKTKIQCTIKTYQTVSMNVFHEQLIPYLVATDKMT